MLNSPPLCRQSKFWANFRIRPMMSCIFICHVASLTVSDGPYLITHSSTNSRIPSASSSSPGPARIFPINLIASPSPFSCVHGPRGRSSSRPAYLFSPTLDPCPALPRPRPRVRPLCALDCSPNKRPRFHVRASSGPGSRVRPYMSCSCTFSNGKRVRRRWNSASCAKLVKSIFGARCTVPGRSCFTVGTTDSCWFCEGGCWGWCCL